MDKCIPHRVLNVSVKLVTAGWWPPAQQQCDLAHAQGFLSCSASCQLSWPAKIRVLPCAAGKKTKVVRYIRVFWVILTHRWTGSSSAPICSRAGFKLTWTQGRSVEQWDALTQRDRKGLICSALARSERIILARFSPIELCGCGDVGGGKKADTSQRVFDTLISGMIWRGQSH